MVRYLKKAKRKKARVLVLFSGGLDSILAAKILEKQGIDVTALTFVSYFFDEEQAKTSAEANKIKLTIENISEEDIPLLRAAQYAISTINGDPRASHVMIFTHAVWSLYDHELISKELALLQVHRMLREYLKGN